MWFAVCWSIIAEGMARGDFAAMRSYDEAIAWGTTTRPDRVTAGDPTARGVIRW